MGCSHYMNLIYGIILDKKYFYLYFNREWDEDEQLYSTKYLDKVFETFSTGKFCDDSDKIVWGFSIGDGNERVLDLDMIPKLQKYNKFFEETPKIIAILGGCSCCT